MVVFVVFLFVLRNGCVKLFSSDAEETLAMGLFFCGVDCALYAGLTCKK